MPVPVQTSYTPWLGRGRGRKCSGLCCGQNAAVPVRSFHYVVVISFRQLLQVLAEWCPGAVPSAKVLYSPNSFDVSSLQQHMWACLAALRATCVNTHAGCNMLEGDHSLACRCVWHRAIVAIVATVVMLCFVVGVGHC